MKHLAVGLWRRALILGAVVGTTMAAVAAGLDSNLPSTQQLGQVTYLSGGIGLDQSEAIKQVMKDYSLTLTFVGTTRNGNEYLAGVPVVITDAHGQTVLDVASAGPYVLAMLPDGRYTIAATYRGKTERRTVSISTTQHVRQVLSWVM